MTINVAMLGTGRIADQQLAPALRRVDGARLWSVLSRDTQRAREFAARHGAAADVAVHTELDALLADPALHAVVVATPDKLHAAQTIAAARAGKHVLVEKPMATEVAQAEAMVRACEEAGVTLAVAYHMRWHAGHRRLAEVVREGRLGELRHMRLQWSFLAESAGNWRASADVGRWWSLAAVGTHCLDQIRWLMVPACGEVVAQESLVARDVWGGPHDETAVVALRFSCGATAELCSSVLFAGPRRMEIYGTGGYAVCEETLGPHGGGEIRVDGEALAYERANPYVGEIADFVAAVSERRAPEVDGREGMRNVAHLVAAVAGAADA